MNKITFFTKILCFLFFAVCVAYADAPGLVNYQGRLRESGAPATGTKSMVFRLYDDPTGGVVVWTSDAVNVDVDRGVFSYKLGSHDPDSSGRYISNLAWSNASVTYWLELAVDGKTLLPRERFTTVPFAFQATNSDTLDGYHAATFASTTTAQALAFSTGTIQSQVSSLALSTGTLQNQLNSIAVSTASLQTQLNSVAGSTTSVQGQINALAVSTGSIQNQVNNLAYSTGTISANLASYSQLNATQTFTAQKTFLNQVTISSNAVITGSAGIGTAAPADKLHVSDGNVRIQGGTPILYLQNTDSPAGTASILNWQKNLIFKNGDGDERLQIREDNNVVINPNDGNVGVGTASPSGWFQVGFETFTVLNNGLVGIGNTDPWEKLRVSGVIVSGNAPSTNGTLLLAGQYSGANNYLTTFGTQYASGGPVVGYGVKPRSSAAGYVSSTSIPLVRSAINVESFISFLSAPSQTTAVGTPITMTENMRILNNGNVGIGTTSPGALINVYKDFGNGGSGGVTVMRVEGQNVSDNAYTLATFVHGAGYPSLVVKADSKVGIGTAPVQALDIMGNTGTYAQLSSFNADADYATAGIALRRARGSATAPSAVQSGDAIGGIYAAGFGTSAFGNNIGAIRFVAAENFSGSAQGTNIVFETTANGAAARSEAVRIANSGNVGIGTTSPGAKLEVNGRIKDQTGFVMPVGSIIAYGAATAPTGWLLCDGTAVSRTTYADLFAAIGTTYGTGDGSTTFDLPDLRGIFPRGAGTSGKLSKADTSAFSGTLGTYANDSLQGHWHEMHYRGTGTGGYGLYTPAGGTSGYVYDINNWYQARTLMSDGPDGTPRAGTETAPASLGVNYIIKY